MSPKLALVTAPLLAALLAARPATSEACSPPPLLDLYEIGPIQDIPIGGVVPVIIRARDLGQLEGLTVDVTDEAGAAVVGAFELTASRLVWRATVPLEPLATYRMAIALPFELDVDVTFRTAAADAPAPGLPTLAGPANLTETELPDATICCEEPPPGSCEWPYCWPQTYRYVPTLRLEPTIDDDVRRFWTFDVTSTPTSATIDSQLDWFDWIGVQFDAPTADYCLTVTATSLVDGAVVSQEVCLEHTALVTIDRSDAVPLDASVCGGSGDLDEDVAPDSGCATGGGSTGLGGLALALSVLIVGRRRRVRVDLHGQRSPSRQLC